MNYELDEQQYTLRDALARYLDDNAGPQVLRTFWDAGSNSTDLWSGLAGLGVQGMTVPAQYGGQGQGLCDAVLLIEELGRHAVPHPVAETLGIVVPVLHRHASSEVAVQWLPRLAAGTALATVQDGWDGYAPWGAEAQLVLVADNDGVSLCVPPAHAVPAKGAQDLARRPLRITRGDAIARIDGKQASQDLRDHARVVLALLLSGLADAALTRAVEYAKMREQFGRPIGSFQAIKHMLANAHVAIETARRPAWLAAWYLDHRDGRAIEMAAVAKAGVGEAALEASYAALQVHGAIGYTWQCDLHLWLKRIHVLEALFGSAKDQWRTLAAIYFDQADTAS